MFGYIIWERFFQYFILSLVLLLIAFVSLELSAGVLKEGSVKVERSILEEEGVYDGLEDMVDLLTAVPNYEVVKYRMWLNVWSEGMLYGTCVDRTGDPELMLKMDEKVAEYELFWNNVMTGAEAYCDEGLGNIYEELQQEYAMVSEMRLSFVDDFEQSDVVSLAQSCTMARYIAHGLSEEIHINLICSAMLAPLASASSFFGFLSLFKLIIYLWYIRLHKRGIFWTWKVRKK